jgi:hypothetical protein
MGKFAIPVDGDDLALGRQVARSEGISRVEKVG